LQKIVYCHKISDIDQLKRNVIDCWAVLSQDSLIEWSVGCQKDWWSLSRSMVPCRILSGVRTSIVCKWSLLFHCVL